MTKWCELGGLFWAVELRTATLGTRMHKETAVQGIFVHESCEGCVLEPFAFARQIMKVSRATTWRECCEVL